MEWLAKLRRKSILRSVWILLLCAGFAALLLFGSGAIGVFKMLAPKNLEDLTPETAEGKYVTAEIRFLYGDFAEMVETRISDTYTSHNTSGRYYMTDFDEETYYMGLYVRKSELPEFEAMQEACYDFIDGLIEWEDLPVITVKGTMTAMNSKELDYYYDYVDYDSEMTDVMVPLYLDMNRLNGQDTFTVALMWVLSLALLAFGGWYVAKAGNQKEVRKVLEASGSFEREAERAAAFYENTQPVCGVRMNGDFVHFRAGQKDILLRPWDVVWCYKHTTRHKLYGIIPVGNSYATMVRTMDGKSYTLPMSEKQVDELLNTMFTAIPGVALGYSEQLANAYANYRQVFADRWEEKVPGCTTRYRANQSPEL